MTFLDIITPTEEVEGTNFKIRFNPSNNDLFFLLESDLSVKNEQQVFYSSDNLDEGEINGLIEFLKNVKKKLIRLYYVETIY